MAKTTTTRYDQIAAMLPHLSPTDLQKVRDRCNALMGISASVQVTGKLLRPVAGDWFAPAVCRHAIQKGWATKDTVHVILSQKALAHIPDYPQRFAAMHDLIVQKLKVYLRGVQLDALGNVIVQAMANHYEEVNKLRAIQGQPMMVVNIKKFLNDVDRVPEILERQLPGYLDNGMLGLVVRMRG